MHNSKKPQIRLFTTHNQIFSVNSFSLCERLKSRIAFRSEDRFLGDRVRATFKRSKYLSKLIRPEWRAKSEPVGVGSRQQMFFSLFGWRGTTAVIKVRPG
jgi:hypothetical protein